MTPSKEKALAALLTCTTKQQAAEKAGISPRTLRGYLADPEFQEEYKKAFSGLITDVTRQSQQSLSPALSVGESLPAPLLRHFKRWEGSFTTYTPKRCTGALKRQGKGPGKPGPTPYQPRGLL